MKSSHARILSLAFFAGTLASCHDTNTSADAMYGPENVLQAPLLNAEENHQFNKVNSELYEAAVKDSMFFTKGKDGQQILPDSGAAAKATDAPAAPAASSDSVKPTAEQPAGHAEHAAH